MKCNQSRPGFELVSPCPFPTTITTTPRAPYISFKFLTWEKRFLPFFLLCGFSFCSSNVCDSCIGYSFCIDEKLIVTKRRWLCAKTILYIYMIILFLCREYEPSRHIRSRGRALSPWLVNLASLICGMNRWPSGKVSASAFCGCLFDLQLWKSRYALQMRPNKVETAVQCSVCHKYVFAGFSSHDNSNIYIYIYIH